MTNEIQNLAASLAAAIKTEREIRGRTVDNDNGECDELDDAVNALVTDLFIAADTSNRACGCPHCGS